MTAAAPLARYGAMAREARVASGSATTELHHALGRDLVDVERDWGRRSWIAGAVQLPMTAFSG
ncbi:MAG: hypothetical protein WBG11_08265 [Methylocella sp.]